MRGAKPSASFSAAHLSIEAKYASKTSTQKYNSLSHDRLGKTYTTPLREDKGLASPRSYNVYSREEDGVSLKKRLEAKIEELKRKSRHQEEEGELTVRKDRPDLFEQITDRLEAVFKSHYAKAAAWGRDRQELEEKVAYLRERLRMYE
jgi:hypothetical protein